MRISTEDGMTYYEANDRKAVVSRNGSGYMVHAMWQRDGRNWIGGHGEGTRSAVTLEDATDLAKRFVTGQSVPEELGGFDDNKPEEAT